MEAQLREYRARKAQEKAKQTDSTNQAGLWRRLWGQNTTDHCQEDATPISHGNNARKLMTPAVNSLQEPIPSNRFLRFLAEDNSFLTNLVFLKVALWLVLFAFFLYLEFAAIYVIVSIFYIIYSTLGTSRRRVPGEPSAYSVFNPNCEQIDGTLTAAQFERELKYGIGSTGK